jgi:cyclic pyranopterin phosphate synthase
MTFLPKKEVLSLEELDRLCGAFIGLGVERIRLTGGEPLVRKNVISLVRSLGARIGGGGLKELTVTTNGPQLTRMADDLYAAGVRRINVSMDTLDPQKFAAITRWGKLEPTLDGIFAARAAGLRVKINAVALHGVNEDEYDRMLAWCGEHGFDLTLIETMPLGQIEADRTDQFLPLSTVRAGLEARWTLVPSSRRTGGPARYVTVEETGGTLGFITPLTHGFCETCNRVRVTCTGTLFLCLGQEDQADLRTVLRANPDDDSPLRDAIREAIARKPGSHDFTLPVRGALPAVPRPMSMTGG